MHKDWYYKHTVRKSIGLLPLFDAACEVFLWLVSACWTDNALWEPELFCCRVVFSLHTTGLFTFWFATFGDEWFWQLFASGLNFLLLFSSEMVAGTTSVLALAFLKIETHFHKSDKRTKWKYLVFSALVIFYSLAIVCPCYYCHDKD